MLIVGLTAVDFAVLRAFWGSRNGVLAGIAFTGLVLNLGLLLLIRARRRARAFWVGFLLAASLGAGSFAWAMTYPKVSATFLDQATGKQVTVRSSGAPLSDEWETYLNLVERSIESLPDRWNPFLNGRFAEVAADASIAFAPQLVVALVGGLLFWLMAPATRAVIVALRGQASQVADRTIERAAR